MASVIFWMVFPPLHAMSFLRRSKREKSSRRVWRWLIVVTFVATAAGAVYVAWLDHTVRAQFEGRRWAVPAQVFARPLELFPGARIGAARFEEELEALGYARSAADRRGGNYRRFEESFDVVARPFLFGDGEQPARAFTARFEGDTVAALESGGRALELMRLDPMLIGRIWPAHNEDRILLKLDEVPKQLLDTLRAVEDKHFNEHAGVDVRAIARALWANLREGEVVQGGSTLTQQLVKNFYLSGARTFSRKIREALMALLLEWHYTKAQILEAYCNEIYLGQDGRRAIHGFGLASEFYFGEPLARLKPHHVALLAGLVKGPSYYDPRQHPERARARRDLVLDVMAREGVISEFEARIAKQQPLDVLPRAASGVTDYPAFLDLVRRQLRRDYREEDLTSEGLRIFTTLDPLAQRAAEESIAQRLSALERDYAALPDGALEGAAIVVDNASGEVLAVAGGRDARFAGFNRALDAERQIGSLIKPVIYLTALEDSARYTLVTPLDDTPLTLKDARGVSWSPENYDKQDHGLVPLHTALAQSYNVATVRLGMAVGLDRVLETLQRLGISRELKPYPSMLLGAMTLTPWEVAQMYQPLANGGFRAPLRAIREVTSARGEELGRYPLAVEQVLDPAAVYLLDTALREAVRGGTGESAYQWLAAGAVVAGKTGTTNDLRDSWFAGYDGARLTVVWVGRDDNAVAGLTGASGALQVWGNVFARMGTQPMNDAPPAGIERAWIDPASGLRALASCEGAIEVPFVEGSVPAEEAPCAQGVGGAVRKSLDWFKNLFE